MEVKWMICDSRDRNWFITLRSREETGLKRKIRCFEKEFELFLVKASKHYCDGFVEQLLIPFTKSDLNTFEFKEQLYAKFYQYISDVNNGTSIWRNNVWSADPLFSFIARKLKV